MSEKAVREGTYKSTMLLQLKFPIKYDGITLKFGPIQRITVMVAAAPFVCNNVRSGGKCSN